MDALARCGWSGSFESLARAEPNLVLLELSRFTIGREAPQLHAWDRSLVHLQREARACVDRSPAARLFGAVLEYELPLEGGRRPDVVVLEDGTVVVIEFKEADLARQADVDQVAAYARDLREYHAYCRERRVRAILVPSRYSGQREERRGVIVARPDLLGETLLTIAREGGETVPDVAAFVDADYAPLPRLVDAARRLFRQQPLPRIRRAESARIPEVHERLIALARTARRERVRRLVLLAGVPGSGKTLVGLQLVHDPRLAALRVDAAGRAGGADAVFLSGNGPLVEVLTYALGSRVFVKPLKPYLREYGLRAKRIPAEHVVVFDEAQRAWDADYVFEKHAGALPRSSEPELLLRSAERIPDWCLVLALVGEGQEIHRGEEAGLRQWRDAVASSPSEWIVHAPARLRPAFADTEAPFVEEPLLDLTLSLRTHRASNLAIWVGLVLQGNLAAAGESARMLVDPDGGAYELYVTRDLEDAKAHVRDRYAGSRDRRFGLVASAKARNLERYGFRNGFLDTRRTRVGPWYEAEPSDPLSCCRLEAVVTEFGCQGLELDFSLLGWGDDFVWDSSGWRSTSRSRGVRDAHRLRTNAYRVLLTRGRDGVCILVPPEPREVMDPTYEALLRAGVRELPILPVVGG